MEHTVGEPAAGKVGNYIGSHCGREGTCGGMIRLCQTDGVLFCSVCGWSETSPATLEALRETAAIELSPGMALDVVAAVQKARAAISRATQDESR